MARGGIVRDHAFHNLQDRFIERGIDHLALTGLVTVTQGRQRAQAAIGRRQTITDRDAHARGRTIRITDNVPPTAHGLANTAKACSV